MPPVTEPPPLADTIRHEHWCRPTGDRTEIRVEQFVAYADDPETGRSAAVKRTTRCLECGEARYDPL